jgi:hypothetical protein
MKTSLVSPHGELSATTEVILVVDKPYMSEELQSPLWERRGFLKRLARRNEPG